MKIIIDSFAGGGGASTGIEMALGRSPDVAINHDPIAIAMHEANHPDTLHLTNDIWGVDPLSVLPGQPVGLMWASPDCKHFSKAKGGAPRDRNIRDLAWVVVDWAEKRKPDVILLENVEEFKTWGPVDNDCEPIKEFSGQTFDDWVKRLKKAGYKVEWRELRACDYGAPTIRKRLFVVARRDGKPIIWPKPTHGDPKSLPVKTGKLKPWRTAAEIIDWSLPCPSMFDTSEQIKEKLGLRAVRPLAAATQNRVARGLKRYVLDAAEPFLVNLTHGARLEAASEPFRTITGANRGEKAVVAPSLVRTDMTSAHKRNGIYDIQDPVRTQMTASSFALMQPFLTYAQQGGANRSIEEPHHTVTASKKDQNCVAAAFLAQHNNDSRREGGVNPGRSAQDPVSTITANPQQGVIGAFIARQFGTSTGHAMDHPSHTVMPDGQGKSQLVSGYFAKYYGTGDGQQVDEPTHTVTTKDRFGFIETAMQAPPLTEAMMPRAREIAAFMRDHGLWDDREFVTLTIAGVDLVVADIGIRMLTPRELFNAQGFPPDYKIDADIHGNRFSKSDQIGRAGNSVSPPMAAALAAANAPDDMRWMEAAE